MIIRKLKKKPVVCPFCKEAIHDDLSISKCTQYGALTHQACWLQNRHCSVFGCSGTEITAARFRRPAWQVDLSFTFILIGFWSVFVLLDIPSGPVDDFSHALFLGLYIYFFGTLFLLSYYWVDASWILKGIAWVCENWSTPRGRWAAVLWGILAFVMGTICIIQSLFR